MVRWLSWLVQMAFIGMLFVFLREVIQFAKLESTDKTQEQPAYLVELPLPGGSKPVQIVPVGDETRLGRDPNSHLVLEDPFVSASHARIYRQEGEFWLEDLGSTNSTYLNGELVSGPRKLAEVAVITVGNAVVVFHTSPNSPERKG
ncbi:MAG: FHA domain-containing protein [Firmicutes bacterium]|jgi:pSer/pThr/pTyr-binding forkhead associated (FHA) protein|nr:FHA domain-containing protein [Bacillota bacterium]